MRKILSVFSVLFLIFNQADAQKKNVKPAVVSPAAVTKPRLLEQFMEQFEWSDQQQQKLMDINMDFLSKLNELASNRDMQPDKRGAAITAIYESRFNDYHDLLNDAGKKDLFRAKKTSVIFDMNNMQQQLDLSRDQVEKIMASELTLLSKQMEMEQGGGLSREALKEQKKFLNEKRLSAIQSVLTPLQNDNIRLLEAKYAADEKAVPIKGKKP